MKLHPITWILLGVTGVQLAAFSIDMAGVVKALNDVRQAPFGQSIDAAFLYAQSGQFLGQGLHRLGGIVVGASLAVWVEVLSRIHRRLRVESARG